MNRRRFLRRLVVFSSVPVLGFGGYEYYTLYHKPDFKYLIKNKFLIANICESFIPKTDTPGAKDAKVEEYIIHTVRYNMNRANANTFIDGLKKVEEICKNRFQKDYGLCTPVQQLESLNSADSGWPFNSYPVVKKLKNKIIGLGFKDLFIDLTAIGYCTSQAGATEGLAYDPIPVDFLPCIPYSKTGKAWATK